MSSNGPEISKSRRVGLILFSLLLQCALSFIPTSTRRMKIDLDGLHAELETRGKRDAIKQRCWQIYATGYLHHSEEERGETALQTPDNLLK